MLMTPWGALYAGASITAEGLAGTASGTSEVTGSPTVRLFLEGSASGTSTVQGGFYVTVPLDGVMAGTSSATGEPLLRIQMVGTAAGESTAIGSPVAKLPLAGSITGTSSAQTTDTFLYIKMSGSVSGSSTFTAEPFLYILLSGTAAGTSEAEGSFLTSLPDQIEDLVEAVFTPLDKVHHHFDFVLTAGSTIPYVRGIMTDQDGLPLDIVDADFTFVMTDKLYNIITAGDAVVEDTSTGQIVYQWGDTSAFRPGVYYAQFKADFGINRIIAIPSARYILIAIQKDLEDEE